jgi:hypothetical protein
LIFQLETIESVQLVGVRSWVPLHLSARYIQTFTVRDSFFHRVGLTFHTLPGYIHPFTDGDSYFHSVGSHPFIRCHCTAIPLQYLRDSHFHWVGSHPFAHCQSTSTPFTIKDSHFHRVGDPLTQCHRTVHPHLHYQGLIHCQSTTNPSPSQG